MEIKIIVDDRVVRWLRPVGNRRLMGLIVGCAVLGGGVGIVHAIDEEPTHSFVNGSTISASAFNQNFEELYAAVSTLEDEFVAFQAEVETAPSPLAACTVHWVTCSDDGSACFQTCPADTHPVGGGCFTNGDGHITRSYPTNATGPAQVEPLEAYDRWRCQTDSGTSVTSFAVCCPE